LYLKWLYSVRQTYNQQERLPPLPPPSELWKRYENTRATQTTPVECKYVLDDPSTWTDSHAAKCKRSAVLP
jgi:hypothetical protein